MIYSGGYVLAKDRAAPVWRQFMEYATRDLPPLGFAPEPPGAEAFRIVPRAVVPDLSGLSGAEMTDAVYGVGLRLARVEVPSTLPEGAIVDVVPRAGTAVRQGSTVSVLVSSGIPEPARVPGLVGRPIGDVAPIILQFRDESGLTIDWAVEEVTVADAARWDVVLATRPGPGAIIEDGATLVVVVGRQPGA